MSWQASSGPSPGACRQRRAKRNKPVIELQGGASEPRDMLPPGKAGGTAAVRRTLVSTICRIADPTLVARPRQLRDVSAVMRFQPAHQSMINRRHDGRASCLVRQSLQQMLERKPRIYLPATCKGGHESGSTLTLVFAARRAGMLRTSAGSVQRYRGSLQLFDVENRGGSRSIPHIFPPARFGVHLNFSFLSWTYLSIAARASSTD